jgi:hypothetical protein
VIQIKKNLDVYLGLKKNKMFNKKAKPYTELLGKTNRIVEGTIIKGDIVSQADFRLDEN